MNLAEVHIRSAGYGGFSFSWSCKRDRNQERERSPSLSNESHDGRCGRQTLRRSIFYGGCAPTERDCWRRCRRLPVSIQSGTRSRWPRVPFRCAGCWSVRIETATLLSIGSGHNRPTNVLRILQDAGLSGLMFSGLRHIYASPQSRQLMVAVGTAVASRPPRRSRCAAFSHRAPVSGRTWSAFGVCDGLPSRWRI